MAEYTIRGTSDASSDISLLDSCSNFSTETMPSMDRVRDRDIEVDREREEDDKWEKEGVEEREGALGFKPQRENPYNRLLPYADKLDEESNKQLAEIKANLARAVQLRDIKIGVTHWTSQLSKYIRLYGFKFSKEDHILFVRLTFELLVIPELDYSMVVKFAQLISSLLKKQELISREELELPWRPLYKLLKEAVYSSHEGLGLVLLPSNVEAVLKSAIQCCRVYFSSDATREMLEEWRPLLCPFDVSMDEGVYFMESFLPTRVYSHEQATSFRLWFDELMGLWEACQNVTGWEPMLVRLFSRLAEDSVGCGIDWEPYIPKLFMSTLRSFNLPVGKVSVNVTPNGSKGNNGYDPRPACVAIASILGNGSSVQEHLNKLFKALESFYHPSNYGRWTSKLLKFLAKLPECVVRRVQRERYWKSWLPRPDPAARLSNADITSFIESIKPILFIAMFNKIGSLEITSAMHYTACLRPELILPPLLERTYPSLETLTEPHRLSACLQCIVGVARSMLDNPRWYPEGRQHVIPLLTLCLPGIDPNDLKKSVMTFHLFATLSSLIPLVDCSSASQHVSNLSEEELELCSSTAQFESLVLQVFDRIFTLIEACIHQHTRADSSAATATEVTATALGDEEAVLELCLSGVTYSILRNCSKPIYEQALDRIHKFVMQSVLEVKVAGRLAAGVVQAAVRVNPQLGARRFVPELCERILERCEAEDVKREERVDNELMWNLKLLSEVVRCDGRPLVEYANQIKAVLEATLHVKCKDILLLSGTLLRNVLKQMTMIYPLNNNLTPDSTLGKWLCSDQWTNGLTPTETDNEDRSRPPPHIPTRDWGRWTNLRKVKVSWHIPNSDEVGVASGLMSTFLVSELSSISSHISGSVTLEREELLQSLNIIHHCLIGAGALLPQWSQPALHIVQSEVALKRFSQVARCDEDDGITVLGENVRVVVARALRPLLDHLLTTSEDDTKSQLHVIMIINSLMLYHGSVREEFEGRWKNRSVVKSMLQNRLTGKKRHIESVLLDRIQLQHEMRCSNQSSKSFTSLHQELFNDLFRLAISRYMQVRKTAQLALGHAFHTFAYSYRPLLQDIIKYLSDGDDSTVERHQLKGVLYLILGHSKNSLVTRRSWEVMKSLWPAMIRLQNCERPSMIRLYDNIIDKLHKDIETTELELTVHEQAVEVAGLMWSSGGSNETTSDEPSSKEVASSAAVSLPAPSLPAATHAEMEKAKETERERNEYNARCYEEVVSTLVELATSGSLGWKYYQVCLEMLSLLIRHDAKLSPGAIQLFTKNLISETINIRKISINAVSAILKQLKRKHIKVTIDPYQIAVCDRACQSQTGPTSQYVLEPAHPGDRRDNAWMQYRRDTQPSSEREWNETVFVDKTHWGYYMWPNNMKTYAAAGEQPKLGRSASELSEAERVVLDYFTDPAFISELVRYLTLEENKGKDKFHVRRFLLFKGLFRNYDDTVVTDTLKQHLETLVSDTSPDTIETSQRCAAEVIAGIVRGSKHWTYGKVASMWAWVVPLVSRAFTSFTVESVRDWGTCLATCSENMDPRRIGPLIELLMDNPLSGAGGSFADSSRLFLLQGLLAQQEWRVAEPLHRLAEYLLPHLSHPYKSVRDRIGSTLVNLFLYDVRLPISSPPSTASPTRQAFFQHIIPQLLSLQPAPSDDSPIVDKVTVSASDKVKSITGKVSPATVASSDKVKSYAPSKDEEISEDNGEDEERKKKIRMCKTVLKWIQGTYSRMFQCISEEIYTILPLACMLESESKDPELQAECVVSLTYMAVGQVSNLVLPMILDVVEQASTMEQSWHARVAVLLYCQLTVFYNLFLVQLPETTDRIRQIVLSRLADSRLEVREMAGVTLAGLLQCGYLQLDDQLVKHFEKLCRTSIKKLKSEKSANGSVSGVESRQSLEIIDSSSAVVGGVEDRLTRRHAGVLGLSACVLAHPYSVPEALPNILMTLSSHLNDPQPIQMTVKKTMAGFKRTHMDSWVEEHKNKFTDDQLSVLTDLLVSPNYYA